MEYSDPSNQSLLKARTEVQRGTAASSHVCVKTRGKRACWEFAFQWYLIFIHLFYTITVTFCMVFWLNGMSFAFEGSPNPSRRLTQPDVTTLVSVALVVSRTISTAWQALTTWRCVFILLERNGLSLAETSRVISWRLPTLRMFGVSHTGNASIRSIAIVILLLAWPAQLSNPIASGSVSWVLSTAYPSYNATIRLNTPTASFGWSWYSISSNARQGVVKASAGRAILGSKVRRNVDGLWLVPPAQRLSPRFYSYPNATAVKNATVPIFKIEDFEWVTNDTMVPSGILTAIRDFQSGYLNISRDDSPLRQMVVGTVALLKDTPWIQPDNRSLPRAEIFSGTKYAAVYVSRNNYQEQGRSLNCYTASSDFDPLPNGVRLINNSQSSTEPHCIAVAKLQITAGVSRCYQETLSPLSNSTCLLLSGILSASNNTVSPSVLVHEVFALMPEVQALVASLSLYDPNSLSGALEVYLRNSLTQAYQGTYSALVDGLSIKKSSVQSEIRLPLALLEARVQARRMYIWLGVNLLLVASGLILFVLQSRCRLKTVNDPVVASILMDSSGVIEADKTGLCNATDIGSGHGNADMKVCLRVGACNENYSHHKLIPQHANRY
ncbi:putative uracil permease [Fusarium austroafricanum]|uniref:Putative uracil permease n=1 Tax=Fusarium austroafricanum TaxID=2364996 RepID=A0A8H4NLX2_9HYPO|nr:putative uracil permease [Fusarium austroafricanum]